MTRTKKSTIVTGVIASLLALVVFVQATLGCEPPPPPPGPGCETPGYWKNHPEAWPVDAITVDGLTYTRDEAIALMSSGGKGDKTLTMFGAVVAAQLNVFIGNPDSTSGAIEAADAWLATYPVGSGVKANSDAWKVGDPLYQVLDDYNNNML